MIQKISKVQLLLSAAILVLLIALSVAYNWDFWPIGMINDDIHREFVTPIRINNGAVLYKDFNFVYPPLPPYLNALIMKLSPLAGFTTLRGISLSLMFLDLLVALLICNKLGLHSLLIPVIVFTVGKQSGLTFNPASFNGIYASLVGNIGVLFAMKTRTGGWGTWVVLGLCMSVAFFSKPEGAFVAGMACVGALWIVYTKEGNRKTAVSSLCVIAGFLLFLFPFYIFLVSQGLSFPEIMDGIFQSRFQKELAKGYFSQYAYFRGIQHVIAIVVGFIGICIVLYLARLWYRNKNVFGFLFFIAAAVIAFLIDRKCFVNVISPFEYLGCFFGGILGYWWHRLRPLDKKNEAFFIFWMGALGGWMRPLFHIGSLVVPYRVGGGIILAAIFWMYMIPSLYKKVWMPDNKESYEIEKVFPRFGAAIAISLGVVGIFNFWNTPLRNQHTVVNTPYGSFKADSGISINSIALDAVEWIKANLRDGERVVVLEGLPIELSIGFLPAIPLSQMNYQIYPGDTERIISTIDDPSIKYIAEYVRCNTGYHFGIQNCRLAQYLDDNWVFVKKFNVPETLEKWTLMGPEQKFNAGLTEGIIVLERKLR